MYTKDFSQLSWEREEELQVLGLPYFYFGKYLFPFLYSFKFILFYSKPFYCLVLELEYHSWFFSVNC